MGTRRVHQRIRASTVALVAAALAAATLAASASGAPDNRYVVHNIFSDVQGAADHVDTNLVNGWGLTAGPSTPWWVSDNGTDLSTLYTAGGTVLGLVVTVEGGPTGTVFNSGGPTSFEVTDGTTTGRSSFLFASEDGKIRGWFNGIAGNVAQVGHDGSPDGAIYKGLTLATTSAGERLYAADFHTRASTSSTAPSRL